MERPSGFDAFRATDKPKKQDVAIPDVVEREYAGALESESYERAATALTSLEALQRFRKELSGAPFASFHELVEAVTNVNRQSETQETKRQQIHQIVEYVRDRATGFSPRVADLFQSFLASLVEESYDPHFEETRHQMAKLIKSKDQRSDFDVLFSGDISWDLKINRIKNVLEGYLNGMRALDKRQGKTMDDDIRRWREAELGKAPTQPSPQRSKSRPGVDPMERLKEGERAPAIWSIHPAWGGLYKEESFAIWDETSKSWKSEDSVYSEVRPIPLSNNLDTAKGGIDITITANIKPGSWCPVPSPYTHSFHAATVRGRSCEIKQNQNGDLFVLVTGTGESVDIKVAFAPDPNKKYTSKDPATIRMPDMPAEFSNETETELREIAEKYKGNMAKARAVRRFVVHRIQYLAPKDRAEADYYNNAYRTSPKGFAGAVDELKKGDCDVVNTYFAALCARLKIPVRHSVGHSVKGKDELGNAIMHSGTGHGWSEVWDDNDREWKDLDSTPPGDPNLEAGSEQSNSVPGYYGEQEAVRPSDEQLEALRKKLAEHKEKLSYTREERELAEGAGVALSEARQIVKEINEAEQTRLPNGELLTDVLAKVCNLLVESRKTNVPSHTGPVRESEGGEEIENKVQHYIKVKGGETDPRTRALPTTENKEELVINGYDVIFIGDKSGSMQSTDEAGEQLWKMQRRAEFLVFSVLHRLEKNLKRAGLHEKNKLSVRTQGVSFRGNGPEDIDLDKPLASDFTPLDKVNMWHSLTQQGGGNGDPEALAYIYEQIKQEIEDNTKKGLSNNRLRVIVACSDGGYVGEDALRMQELARQLHDLDSNIILVGIGLTETAAEVPVVMNNPPYSRGDLAKTINDLPALYAKHIIIEAIKLFPEKARTNAMKIITNTLNKFKNIS